jgi:ribonucleotide monophosphatase NagD (HAD superfamily)
MKSLAGIAFDATGVFYKSNKALPRAKEAMELLVKHKIPFVILTNASDRTEAIRANFLNSLMGTDILKGEHVILGHTPIKKIYEDTKYQPGLTLINGNAYGYAVAEECNW